MLAAAKAVEAPTYSSTVPSADASLRLLVVDDNKYSAESLSLLLQLLGNNVSSAYDGEQAVEMANELKPDALMKLIQKPKPVTSNP